MHGKVFLIFILNLIIDGIEMCGILGSINNTKMDIFKNSLTLLNHRGPDNQGIYSYKNCLFGHTRLSIIDLDKHSNQPMQIDDLVIIFNGEIYNYIEIRDELVRLGYSFNTQSDTEVMLKSYQEWGYKCVEKFNGMWAFAILDKTKNIVFLSRDRLGVKPLYYIYDDKQFIFASEIKALLPYLDRVVANKDEMVRYIIYGAQEHRKITMFKNVLRFPASYNAVFYLDKNKLDFFRYYKFYIKGSYDYNEKTLKNKIKKLIYSSVNLRLRSDVKIGMALSGGIDSNIIVSIANQQNKSIESFSSIYEGEDQINENKNIDKTVKKLNLRHHYIISDVETLVDNIEKLVWHQDEPFDTLGMFAQFNVYKDMNENGVKVSLDGQGADEVFAGYETYRAIILRENIFNLKFIFQYLKYCKNNIKQDFKLVLLSFIPSLFERLFFIKRSKKIFNNKMKFIPSKKNMFKYFNNLNKKLLIDIQEHLSVLLRYLDRNSMAFSIESRGPFLDFRVVQTGLNIPSNLKWSKGYSKYILRKSFENEVLNEILWNREKKGFPVPQKEWCNNEKFLNKVEPYLKKSKILKKLNVNLNIDKSDPMFWKIVNIAIWEKVFKIEGIV